MVDPGSTSDKPKFRVVAVIPCYNTAPHIAEVVTKARQYKENIEEPITNK